MDPKLLDFIAHARQKGMDHGTIRVMLLSAGWKERDVARGLAEQGLDMPVPEPPSSGGAREAFQYLMVFSALYVSVVNVILILFHFLDDWFPDPAHEATSYSYFGSYRENSIRWSLAMLMVATPLFYGFAYWIGREIRRVPDRSKSPIRRWLTYLTLFVAAITMMVDVATLIFGLLQGDTTAHFLLKALTILALAALAFCYYFLSLQPFEPQRLPFFRNLDWSFAAIAATIVGLSMTLGFVMVESPLAARLRRFDERRVSDLQAIADAIERMSIERDFDGDHRNARLKRPLPESLDQLNEWLRDDFSRQVTLFDPQTAKPYEYRVKSETTYELCAEFSLSDTVGRTSWSYGSSREWNHPSGRHCFEINALK
ncbi:MAG TPA: DUF5671 domain-containing protein [Pirellulaceae bacterium]|nr:DUF5671 domain-containing protein [Pirellulaceae bacterium]